MQKFLADHGPDKRAKLIDALLERPEFVDYWAYKWSDLLLDLQPQAAAAGDVGVLPVRPPERGRQQAVGPLRPRHPHRQRQHAAATAPANYFVLHKDVTDLTESDGGHVPGHVDHLLPLPQSSAGEMDAGPILEHGQPVRAASA